MSEQTVREHLARALIEVTNARSVLKRKYPEDPPGSLAVPFYRTEIALIQRQLERLLNGEREI